MFRFQILIALIFVLNGNASIPKNETVLLGSGQMFDSIAPYYDVANTIMSLGQHHRWRRYLVDAVLQKVPMTITNTDTERRSCPNIDGASCENFKIMDLATGTGDVAIVLASRLLSAIDLRDELNVVSISITGVDPSTKMLSIADSKVQQKKLSSLVKLRVGNAEKLLDFNSNEFNAITMSFGIRNVPNRSAALAEMFRVLIASDRDGVSNLFIMEFVHPSEGWLAPVSSFFLRYLVPLLGSFAAGGHAEEYKHLADSIQNFPTAQEFVREIEAAGFRHCRAENVFFHIVYLFACEKPGP